MMLTAVVIGALGVKGLLFKPTEVQLFFLHIIMYVVV